VTGEAAFRCGRTKAGLQITQTLADADKGTPVSLGSAAAGLEGKEGTKRPRREWLPAASPASETQPG